MWLVVLSVIALLVLTTLMHYEVLVGMSRVLPDLPMTPRFKLVMVILGSFVSHMLQMVLFACAYYLLSHALQSPIASRTAEWSWTTCLYFSAETFTSLGFGDIVPTGALRLLAGAECLNGLLLIGWSASYTYISMERYWKPAGSATSSTG